MKTVKEVIAYIESRTGGKFVDGFFVTTGGGLHALEALALEQGLISEATLYRQQRAELVLLLTKLTNADTE